MIRELLKNSVQWRLCHNRLEGNLRGPHFLSRSTRAEEGGGESGCGGQLCASNWWRESGQEDEKNEKWHDVEWGKGKFLRRFEPPRILKWIR